MGGPNKKTARYIDFRGCVYTLYNCRQSSPTSHPLGPWWRPPRPLWTCHPPPPTFPPNAARFALFGPHEQIAIDREFFSFFLLLARLDSLPPHTHTHTFISLNKIYGYTIYLYLGSVRVALSFFSLLITRRS